MQIGVGICEICCISWQRPLSPSQLVFRAAETSKEPPLTKVKNYFDSPSKSRDIMWEMRQFRWPGEDLPLSSADCSAKEVVVQHERSMPKREYFDKHFSRKERMSCVHRERQTCLFPPLKSWSYL